MQPKSTSLHKELKKKHNIHKKSAGTKTAVVLHKETTHNLKAGRKPHSKKSNVGKKGTVIKG